MATIFQTKFMQSGDSIREWIKHNRVPLHLSTVALVLGEQGQIPSVENHLIIGYCLGFTLDELKQQMVDRFNTETEPRTKRIAQIFSKLITPSDLAADEMEMIDRLRAMPKEKRSTVLKMVEQMGV